MSDGHPPGDPQFDREINVRGVAWTGVILVIITALSYLLMWWMLRGFEAFDEKRDVRLAPIEAANPQPRPPGPQLQISPTQDLREMRQEEDRLLGQAGWIDRRQGIVRLPVTDAIDLVAARSAAAPNPAPAPTPVPSPAGAPAETPEETP
jgi:hypothetical protein